MSKQYYAIQLEDYTLPSYLPFPKTYYGTMEQIDALIRCLDANRFFDDKDKMDYTDYPDYLYDDFLGNDASYLFNKDILMTAVQNLHGYMATGDNSMSFDAYINWSDFYTYGKAAVDMAYDPDGVEQVEGMLPVTEEEYAMMEQNIEQNID